MPLSATENKRYRERRDNDPLHRAEYLEKERKKYRNDLSNGKKIFVEQMTDREKRHQRKERKKRKQIQRERVII
jgi:GTPase involved in cell partitioning and DNA repair